MTALNGLRKITKVLRNIPGAVRLIDPVRRHFGNAGEHVIDDFDGNIKMSLRLGEHMESQIFWYGKYCRDIPTQLKRFLRPGMTFFDVGANIGEVSMLAAKYVGPSGKVFSFEPFPGLAERLRRHKALNKFEQVEVIEAALGKEAGQAQLLAASGLYRDGTANSGMVTMFRSEKRNTNAGWAKIMRADDFVQERGIKEINMMKIDIEGAELSMLEGSSNILRNFRPNIIIEINNETCLSAGYNPIEILDLLEEYDYKFFRLWRRGIALPLDKKNIRAWQNVLCIPR